MASISHLKLRVILIQNIHKLFVKIYLTFDLNYFLFIIIII